MSVEINPEPGALILAEKWPRIARFLTVEPTGWVTARYHEWILWTKRRLSPAELAADYEQWADFHEWRLAQRPDAMAGNAIAEQDTDELVYLCRRGAAFARGEDPGPWVPCRERRPDLTAQLRADRQLAGAGAA